MTKVMISLPDDVLERLDREAQLRGLTRSGLIAQFADEASAERHRVRAVKMAQLNSEGCKPRGGNSADLLKQERDQR